MSILSYKKLHLFLALTFLAPILIVFTTGLILITKQFFPGIQAPVIDAPWMLNQPIISLQQFKEETDIEQVIYRPQKNNISIRYKNDMEKQIHAQTGEVLSYTKRHTNWLIRVHQGSYFSETIKKFIFIPTAIALQGIWITGLILYLKTRKRKKGVSHEFI